VGCDKTDWRSGEAGCYPIGGEYVAEEINNKANGTLTKSFSYKYYINQKNKLTMSNETIRNKV
jgi:hypothetical protein